MNTAEKKSQIIKDYLSELLNFIEAYFHTAIYCCHIYPDEAFDKRLLFNTCVYAFNVEELQKYMNKAMDDLELFIISGTVEEVQLVIINENTDEVLLLFEIQIENLHRIKELEFIHTPLERELTYRTTLEKLCRSKLPKFSNENDYSFTFRFKSNGLEFAKTGSQLEQINSMIGEEMSIIRGNDETELFSEIKPDQFSSKTIDYSNMNLLNFFFSIKSHL